MAKISTKNMAEAIYSASDGVSGHDLAVVLKRSVQVLKDKHMLDKSPEVLYDLQKIFDEKSGTVRMKVTSAKGIGAEERSKLEREIKEKYNAKKAVGEFFMTEELLGGTRVEVGDEILDNTYGNKLRELEKFLIQTK